MSKYENLVLLVDTPSVSPHDVAQMRSLGLTSVARHARYVKLSHSRTSTQGVPVTTSLAEPALFAKLSSKAGPIVAGKMSQVMLSIPGESTGDAQPANDVHVPSPISRKPYDRSIKSRVTLSARDIPMSVRATRRMSAACRAQVTPERVRQFQADIDATDSASVTQIECKPNTYPSPSDNSSVHEAWYTVRLILSGEPGTDLEPRTGKQYRLAVDTGGSAFWFYARHFQERVQLETYPEWQEIFGDYTECDWFDTTSLFRQKYALRSVVPRSQAPMQETASLIYLDGGALSLARWPVGLEYDIPFLPPAWDWVQGSPAYLEDYKLRFSRVLALAVDRVTAEQGNDGNIGVAVPGYREPWINALSKDKVTFFDILNEGPGLGSAAMCLFLRFLPPNGHLLALANKRVQSFMYYGAGSPCGYLRPGDEKIMIPEFTSPLYIFPDLEDRNQYRWWTLQLLSMTLLEPLSANPNYGIIDPIDWTPQHIPINEQGNGALRGIRVMFDSGSMCSVLPRSILQKMWTQWFNMHPQDYPNATGAWLHHNRDFSRHDIVFQFRDCFGTVVFLRCSAADFLTSPWAPPGQPGATMACFVENAKDTGNDADNAPWILGVNFFWACMLKLDARHRGERPTPGQSAPFIQLAPQRIVSEGQKVAGPWELELHEHLPPRLQATLREQRELRA